MTRTPATLSYAYVDRRSCENHPCWMLRRLPLIIDSSLQPILSLISLVGATASQDGRPEAHGISGTAYGNDSHWAVALDFLYATGVPGYDVNGLPGQQPGFAIGDTTSLTVYGNWLVEPTPEPSPWAFGVLAVLVFWARRLVAQRHDLSGCLEACPARIPHCR